MRTLLRHPLRLILLAAAALSTTACVVEPYDPYYSGYYYEPAPTVYVDGYYHYGHGYYHHGGGRRHGRDDD